MAERMKAKYPDGKGGWTEIEGEKMDGMKADEKDVEKSLAQTQLKDIGDLVEKFWQYGRVFQQERNLSNEDIAFAVALLCCNVRETFPGGKEKFDQVAADAADYYDTTR